MKPNDFAYAKAQSVDHALELLAGNGDTAKILAGGQSLNATLNMRTEKTWLCSETGLDADRPVRLLSFEQTAVNCFSSSADKCCTQ